MSFEDVAALLLPLDPAGDGGAVLRADDRWQPEPRSGTARVVVWGREPTWEPAGTRLAGYAWRRERALARLRRRGVGRLELVGAHRWSYRFYRARMAAGAMWRLREGLIVELARDAGRPRVLDGAADAAGALGRLGTFHIAAGGGIAARPALRSGGPAVLRVGAPGSPADPARSARGLELLAALRLPCVPEVLARGEDAGAAWSLESLLPGRPPARLSAAVLRAVADFCAQLPRRPEPPSDFHAHFTELARLLPGFAPGLRALESRTAPVIAGLPSVLAHGDLWANNLLWERGTLSGVVDWDAWSAAAVPGTDLVHLVAAAEAFRRQRTFAELVQERPWRGRLLSAPALSRYWQALEIEPAEEVLEAVTVAWWASQTVSQLRRIPVDATSAEWQRRNVAPALGVGPREPPGARGA